jgi:amidohydrolase
MIKDNRFNYDDQKYTSLRHALHQIPEIGFNEIETKAFILNYIKAFNNINKAKITEVLETGFWIDVKGEGKAISDKDITFALRTDTDALPLIEESNVDYKSKYPGMSHSCGHDGHMTILTCTLEKTLDKISEIPSNVTIRFLYQPAEEGKGGAEKMIEQGCLDGIQEIYGIHNMTLFKVGEVGLITGPIMAGINFFFIEITGIGGHGSMPNLARSPITAGAELVNKINQITAQRVPSDNRCVVSIGSFKSGNAGNVIPEKAYIQGTLRIFNSEAEKLIKEEFNNICKGIGEANKCTITISYTCPGTITNNDENLTKNVVVKALEKSSIPIKDEGLPVSASEDFSFYQEKIPGVFLMLGCGDDDHKEYLHTPTYNYNDKSTVYGVEVYLSIIEQKIGYSLYK